MVIGGWVIVFVAVKMFADEDPELGLDLRRKENAGQQYQRQRQKQDLDGAAPLTARFFQIQADNGHQQQI